MCVEGLSRAEFYIELFGQCDHLDCCWLSGRAVILSGVASLGLSFLAIFILISRRINSSLEVILRCSARSLQPGEVEARDSDVPAERSVWEGIAGEDGEEAGGYHHEALPLPDAIEPFRKWNFIAGARRI